MTVLIHTPQLPSREATLCPPSLCLSISGPCAQRVFVGLTHGAQKGDSCRPAGHGLSPWARPCLDAQGQVRLTSRFRGSVSHLGTWHPTRGLQTSVPSPQASSRVTWAPADPCPAPVPRQGLARPERPLPVEKASRDHSESGPPGAQLQDNTTPVSWRPGELSGWSCARRLHRNHLPCDPQSVPLAVELGEG